jgi:hypothetical protein
MASHMPELRSPIAVPVRVPRITLRDLVEARPAAHRTIHAECVDAAHHEARIARAEHLIAKSHALDGAGLEVLDHDVRAVDQALDCSETSRLAKIDAHAALVTVAGQIVRAHATVERPPCPAHIAVRTGFDLDHIRAEIGQHHRAERSRQRAAQFDDLDSLQRLHSVLQRIDDRCGSRTSCM